MPRLDPWSPAVKFFVPGDPAPGGSKRFVGKTKEGVPILIDDCKRNKGWRATVVLFAKSSGAVKAVGPGLLDEPLRVRMTFYRRRPKGHYGTGRNAGTLKPWAVRLEPTAKPDALKLARSTEDALTGVLWKDDASTVRISAGKAYSARTGAMITIFRRKRSA